jgi:hypothetical protein
MRSVYDSRALSLSPGNAMAVCDVFHFSFWDLSVSTLRPIDSGAAVCVDPQLPCSAEIPCHMTARS